MPPSQTGIVRLSKGDRHRISFKSIIVARAKVGVVTASHRRRLNIQWDAGERLTVNLP